MNSMISPERIIRRLVSSETWRPISRRSVIVMVLVCLNVVFALGLLSRMESSSTAWAQVAGRGGGGFITVAAKPSGQTYDVLYLVDLKTHQLSAFYPTTTNPRQLIRAEPRDLKTDFGL